MSIYFLAAAVKTHYKSESYCWKLACTLISLMNENAQPCLGSSQSIEAHIDSFTTINTSDVYVEPRGSPTFFTMLLFHRAFCEYAFNDNFGFLMRNDPYFGSGTFGQLARFMPERVYIMYMQLSEFKEGKWKDKPEFAKYLKALEAIPEISKSCADKDFVDKLPTKFIEEFGRNLENHVLNRWRSNKLAHYVLGGTAPLAKEFGKAICHHVNLLEDGVLVDTENGGNTEQQPPYVFLNTSLTLGDHHTMSESQGSVTINIKECITYLTAGADFEVIRNNKFVKEYWILIEKLAMAEKIVCLFDKMDDGESVACIIFIK